MLSPEVAKEEFERSNLVDRLGQIRGYTTQNGDDEWYDEVSNLIWELNQLVCFYGKVFSEFWKFDE